MPQPTVFLNGTWISASDLHISVDDLGFLVAATVTERLRSFGGKVFRLPEHIDRLRNSLKIVGLDSSTICNQIETAIPEFVRSNHALIDAGDDWSIIAFVTPGISGTQPTVCVHGYPLPFKSWSAQFETGLPVVVSRFRQVPPNSVPPQLKCRSRMHFYLADREAAARQPGARAILLDQDGFVAEATTANVIIFRQGEGFISPPHDNILAGVSLGVVEELAKQIDVLFITRRFTEGEFCSADEALLTSTSICALPIVECNGRPIGADQPGPTYRRLLSAWNNLVGLDIAEQARRYAGRPWK
jgi:branched-subunit amino acid aminotransferase/4-amino-4-deoxychorismate lyase